MGGLPARVVALRMWLFARINGQDAITIPGPLVDAAQFKAVYGHPAANGRSRGAALSDLFWYWLSPGAAIHQEHLEPGERYEAVAQTTRRILALSPTEVEELGRRHTAAACAAIKATRRSGRSNRPVRPVYAVRLRDVMMPVWAGFFADVVFGGRSPRGLRDLVVANANDVVTALKCCGLRHLDRRDRLTRFLVEHLDEVAHPLPAGLSREEQALYLQGTFFNTAVVQLSEAMAHMLMVLAQHPALQDEVAGRPDDRPLLDHAMAETMRLYPLFGVAHRITSDDITLDDRTTLPAGSVLCFSYPDYHRSGFEDPERFDPARWERISARDAHFVPYGVAANRPCPAWHLAPIAMRAATREVVRQFRLHSTAEHTRSLPNRGPCLLVRRRGTAEPSGQSLDAPGLDRALERMRRRDRAEDVGRSLVQLVLGTYMVWDARRQRLCQRHFETTPTVL